MAGTTFFKITRRRMLDLLSSGKKYNKLVEYLFLNNGWKILDIDATPGSKIVGDTLYAIMTDNQTIYLEGEECDPMHALDDFGVGPVEEAGLVREPDDLLIGRLVSPLFFRSDLDIDSAVMRMMKEGYTFKEVADMAKKMGFIY